MFEIEPSRGHMRSCCECDRGTVPVPADGHLAQRWRLRVMIEANPFVAAWRNGRIP
jgi:hypothetical protein